MTDNMRIYDNSDITISEMRSECKKLKMKHGLDLVIVDYLQLMNDERYSGNRVQEISQISRGLKKLAKECNCPVIALSQLSRSVEQRPDKRPMLSDLRESGSIEQDADVVMFIYRDEYYGITEDENGESTKGVSEILIAKHRGGSLGKVKLKFIGHTTSFEDPKDVYVETYTSHAISSSENREAEFEARAKRQAEADEPF